MKFQLDSNEFSFEFPISFHLYFIGILLNLKSILNRYSIGISMNFLLYYQFPLVFQWNFNLIFNIFPLYFHWFPFVFHLNFYKIFHLNFNWISNWSLLEFQSNFNWISNQSQCNFNWISNWFPFPFNFQLEVNKNRNPFEIQLRL